MKNNNENNCCIPDLDKINSLKDKLSENFDENVSINQSEIFKALSDATRLKIIYILALEELCVCEMVEIIGIPQSTLSHHLNVLKHAGLIKGRKNGLWIQYRLQNHDIISLIHEIGK